MKQLFEQLNWITNDWGLIDLHDKFERQEAVYFRKDFCLLEMPQKATLTVFSNGITNLYMNGADVSREYLAPGPSEFVKSLSYRKYDALPFLKEKNALLVVAGDGWYCGEYTQRERAELVHGVKIAIVLELEYANGRTETITTDESWKTFRGAIGLNDIYHGEVYDARKMHTEYSDYFVPVEKYDLARKTDVHVNEFTEYDVEPVRKISEIIPKALKRSSTGAMIYDFGQNFSGVIEIEVQGECGQTIVMRHAEVLTTDGADIYTENLRVARATDTYILNGKGIENYIPTLTYHGFRYAEVAYDESKVELISIKGIVLHSDLKVTGSFESDNELLNKIYSCALWGAKSNLVCIPTDCPQRNERFGWLADAQVFTKTAVNMFDCQKIYDFYMKLIEKGTIEEGNVPVFVPRIPKIGSKDAVFGWSDAVIIIPYVVYSYYGNKDIIKKYAPFMKSYMEYCARREPGFLQSEMKYGDWLNAGQETDRVLIATAYYAHSAELLSFMLGEIGDSESKKYSELFENVKNAFRNEFFDFSRNRFKEEKSSQTAYALGLCFNLLTVNEVKDGLIEELQKYDNHVMCGFMGANLILPALCECGQKELALSLMLNESYPSWGYCIRNGATTFWERWDSYRAETNSYDESGMNSFNHYSFGSCAEWLFTHLVGINPIVPGFEKVQIKPFIPKSDRLTKVSGYHETEKGKISVKWWVEGDIANVVIEKPAGIIADFVFENVISIEQDGKNVEKFDGNSKCTCIKIKL
ncbi:MAG: family 78 glycoside hydrolase catalytic domain [Clostridia bacterium]|nr:family 78 glycoside hydrolase catalytic domain [Clostridia bacterium]